MGNQPLLRTIGALSGALLLMSMGCTPAEDSSSRPDTADSEWAGIWPQDSRQEAEQAQEAADRGDDSHEWQRAPDGVKVALRHAREQLGWTNFQGHDLHVRGSVRRLRVLRCAPRPNPDYPKADCAPTKSGVYPAVYITLRQLLVRGNDGLWFVTDVFPNELRQVDPVDPRVVRRTVGRFMQRRIDGAGAEEFLSDEGRKEFGRGNPLYSPVEGSPNADFEIVFVDGPSWPFSSFEVGVRMILESGAALEDTLFVSPGKNVHGEKKRVVVHGLRPGLDGP